MNNHYPENRKKIKTKLGDNCKFKNIDSANSILLLH